MTKRDLDEYWEAYGGRWIEFYDKKIKAKCAMAAVAVGLWVEDQEGQSEAERWVVNCMNKGLFEVKGN